MNKDVIRKWVDALRSGKYPQTRGALTRINFGDSKYSYCCLGVLCELASAEGVCLKQDELYSDSHQGFVVYNETSSTLPDAVISWAGLDSYNPRISGKYLSELNDVYLLSFSDIADLIEKEFLGETNE
jgi:hypothetical protein